MFEQLNSFTPELMRMCHEYQAQDVYEEVTFCLKEDICDTNAVRIWFEAERIKNEEMKNVAIEYIAHKTHCLDIAKVAEIDDAYKSPELIKSLLTSRLMAVGSADCPHCQPRPTYY